MNPKTPRTTRSISEHETLIRAWMRGDPHVAELLYQNHRTRAYTLAFSLVHNGPLAEDIAQEALSFALLNPTRFDPNRGRFSAWVSSIVIRSCRTALKTQRRRQRLLFWVQHKPTPSPPSPEQRATHHQTQTLLWEALQTLSPPLREAVVLRIWGEHTYPELGTILGCPQRTAQSRVRLGLNALREHLQHHDLEDLLRLDHKHSA